MARCDLFDSIDLSSRRRRRAAAQLAARLVGMIHLAEYGYMERIPQNLQSGAAYEAAEQTLECLQDAISSLEDAYL